MSFSPELFEKWSFLSAEAAVHEGVHGRGACSYVMLCINICSGYVVQRAKAYGET